MLNAIRADSPGVKKGKLILRFLGEDQKRYDLALTPRAAIEALMALLQGAKSLPRNDQATVEGTIFQGGIVLGVGPQMQPLFVLSVGGLEIPIAVSEQQLASLNADISQFLAGTKH